MALGLGGTGSLLNREVLPFVLALLGLVVAALLLDAVLHLADAVWIGRYLGILGTVLILVSLRYSLRKRKIITGNPVRLLRLHEWLAWGGSLLVLVHAGIHFNAVLAWLALGAMLVTVGSGLTGKFLLARARRFMEASRQELRAAGLAAEAMEERLHWDSLTFDAIAAWRVVHMPITLAFAVLATAHILSILLFWGWR